jgi:phosphoglucomutase
MPISTVPSESREMIRTIQTNPFDGQKPGTSGRASCPGFPAAALREIHSIILRAGGFSARPWLAGWKIFNREVIQTAIRMAAANGFGRVLTTRGLLSTRSLPSHPRLALGIILPPANPGGLTAISA